MGGKITYELMNKDTPLLLFSVDPLTEGIEQIARLSGTLPIGFEGMADFLHGRRAPSNRSHIRDILRACKASTLVGYLDVVHGLSVTDTFWTRRQGSDLSWGRVSIFANGFDRVVERIAFEGGLFGEELSSPSPEASLGGSFAKCVCRRGGELCIMKGPMEQRVGESWAPWSEVMACQVAEALSLNHVRYELHWHRSSRDGSLVPTSVCPLFTSESVGFASARRWMRSPFLSYGEILGRYENIGEGERFREMVVLDALTMNTDRHMGNHGIVFDTRTLRPLGMAPIFDNNMAFMQGFSWDGTCDAYEEARARLTPAIGADFNDIADHAMTADMRRRVHDLGDFEFDRAALAGMPGERIDAMEGIVRRQARCLSVGGQFYSFSLPPEPEEDLSWQLEGWPDDELAEKAPLASREGSARALETACLEGRSVDPTPGDPGAR